MKKRILFFTCIIMLTTHTQQFAMDDKEDAGGFSFRWPRKIDIDVTPTTLISMLGLGVGLYGAKLYSQGSEKVAQGMCRKNELVAEGNQLQWEGLKLMAAGFVLILQKKVVDTYFPYK